MSRYLQPLVVSAFIRGQLVFSRASLSEPQHHVLFIEQFSPHAQGVRLAAEALEPERSIKLLRRRLAGRHAKQILREVRNRSGSLKQCVEQCAPQTLPTVSRRDIHAPNVPPMSSLETPVAIEAGSSNQPSVDESAQHEAVVTSLRKATAILSTDLARCSSAASPNACGSLSSACNRPCQNSSASCEPRTRISRPTTYRPPPK